ncbi:MAG: NUDIX domain-containing protein [Patescibacteria group bacterium]
MRQSAGALITYGKKVLVLLRDDIPEIPDPGCWQLIGGYLEPNETPLEALIREIKEEANLQISKDEPIEIGRVVLFGKQEYFLYWIKLPESKIKNIKLGNEGQRIGFFSIDELEKMKLGSIVSGYLQEFKEGLRNIVEKERLNKSSLGFGEGGIIEIK